MISTFVFNPALWFRCATVGIHMGRVRLEQGPHARWRPVVAFPGVIRVRGSLQAFLWVHGGLPFGAA